MRRIACEEDPAEPPLAGDEGMEAVACRPPQSGVVRGEPFRQELPDLLGLLASVIFLGQQHDLPSAMIAGADDERGRACRIAILGSRLRQLAERFFVHKDVDHEPGLVEHQILKNDAELLANAARCAVAGNHIVCRHCPRLAVIAAQVERNARLGLFEVQ